MAARPLLRHLCDVIEQQGGDDVIFDRMAAGEPVRKIIKSYINPKTGKPFTHAMIYHWIHKGGEEREARWKEAKAIAAHSHVEEAGEILDDAGKKIGMSSADASITKARAEHRKWLASMYNKDAYGEEKQAAGTVNIGTLHLGALMKAGSAKQLQAPEPEEAEFEVIEE